MIRPATTADAPTITSIWNHYIGETTVTFLPDEKSVEDVEKMIATDVCLVADDGGVQGFARYFQFRGGRGYFHTVEHTVLLAPGTAGRGYGRGLMKALMAHAAQAGKHSMWAGVSGENTAGVSFHVALGFEEIARLPEVGFKFGRWIDLVLMQKRL
jgi:L-amino acid N-acyltransferase YncA